MLDLKKFGAFIQDLRKQKGLTQDELGKRLNVTDRAVSRWECGECYPEITQLDRLAGIFDITVDDLLSGATPNGSSKQLYTCDICKNKESCLKDNFKKLPFCKDHNFYWSLFGIIITSLFIIILTVYIVSFIIGRLWNSWQTALFLALILFIIFIATFLILAMFFSLKEIKKQRTFKE